MTRCAAATAAAGQCLAGRQQKKQIVCVKEAVSRAWEALWLLELRVAAGWRQSSLSPAAAACQAVQARLAVVPPAADHPALAAPPSAAFCCCRMLGLARGASWTGRATTPNAA